MRVIANINEDLPKALSVLPKATPSRNRPELGALSLSEWEDTREAVNTPKDDRTIHQIALFKKYKFDRTRLNESGMPPGLPTIIWDTLTNWENNPGKCKLLISSHQRIHNTCVQDLYLPL
jgi:hypothetical protein